MEVGIFYAKGAGGQATAKRFRTSAIYANFNQLLDRVHITKRRKPLIRRVYLRSIVIFDIRIIHHRNNGI